MSEQAFIEYYFYYLDMSNIIWMFIWDIFLIVAIVNIVLVRRKVRKFSNINKLIIMLLIINLSPFLIYRILGKLGEMLIEINYNFGIFPIFFNVFSITCIYLFFKFRKNKKIEVIVLFCFFIYEAYLLISYYPHQSYGFWYKYFNDLFIFAFLGLIIPLYIYFFKFKE